MQAHFHYASGFGGPRISEHNKITGYLSLYKVEPKIYRAGVSLTAGPKHLPAGLEYTKFEGGKYSRFVLTGSPQPFE